MNIDHTFTMPLRVNKEYTLMYFLFSPIIKKLLSHWTSRPHLSFFLMKDSPIQRSGTSSMTGKFFFLFRNIPNMNFRLQIPLHCATAFSSKLR